MRVTLCVCGILLAAVRIPAQPAGAAPPAETNAAVPAAPAAAGAADTAAASAPGPDAAVAVTETPSVLDQVLFAQASPVAFENLRVVCRYTSAMDTAKKLRVTCGPSAPYTAYTVPGTWETPRIWSGRIRVGGPKGIRDTGTLVVGRATSASGAGCTGGTYPFTVSPFFSYYRALHLLETGAYQDALAAADVFAAARPGYGDGHVVRAKILTALGRKQDALRSFEKAYAVDPVNVDACFGLAAAAYAAGRYERAAALAGRIETLTKPSAAVSPFMTPDAGGYRDLTAGYHGAGNVFRDGSAGAFVAGLGRLAAEKGQWEQALGHFKDLAAMDPGNAAYQNMYADALLAVGQTGDAEKRVFRALSADSGYAPARFNLGVIMGRRDSVQAAVAAFRPFLAHPQLGSAARLNTAVAMARAGKPAAAERAFAQLAGTDRAGVAAGYNLALAQVRGRKYTAALATLDGLNGARPVTDAYLRGTVALAQGQPGTARTHFAAALAVAPLALHACTGMGDAFYAEEKFVAAQAWYQRAVGIAPVFADGYRKLGQAYGRLGMRDKELAGYARAAELARAGTDVPADPDARVLAITTFARSDDGAATHDWLGTGIAEALHADLKKISGIRLAERLRVEKTVMEKALAAADMVKAAPGLAVALEADAVVAGSYAVAGSTLSITARVVRSAGGTGPAPVTVQGRLNDVLNLERKLGLALVAALGHPVPPGDRDNVLHGSGSAAALRYLAEGRQAYYRGNLEQSLAAMRKAVELDAAYLDQLSGMDLVSDEEKTGKTLAVLAFRNSAGDAAYAWMRNGIAEALITDLKKVTGLYLVERMDLKKAMDEINLGMTDLVDEGTAPEIGRLVGAGVVLMGAYQVSGGNVRIDARMVDVASGGILMGETVQGPLDNIFELEEHLAFKIADRLNIAVSLAERESIVRKANPTFNALRSIAIAQGGPEGEAADAAYDLAVVRFANNGAEEANRYDWLQAGIHQAVSSEFRRSGLVNLVDQRIVDARVGSQSLVRLAGLGSYDAAAGSRVPADLLVQGEYGVSGATVELKGRIVNTATGEALVSETFTGPADDPTGAGLVLAGKLSVGLRDRLNDPGASGGSDRGRGYVPLWWGYAATGVMCAATGYYAYRYSAAQGTYDGLTAADPAADWDYWHDARTGAYRARNFFIGMAVTAAAGTGMSWVWNRYLRKRFIREAPASGADVKTTHVDVR